MRATYLVHLLSYLCFSWSECNFCPFCETGNLIYLTGGATDMTNREDYIQNWTEGKGQEDHVSPLYLPPACKIDTAFPEITVSTDRNPKENSNKLLTMLSTETKSQHAVEGSPVSWASTHRSPGCRSPLRWQLEGPAAGHTDDQHRAAHYRLS